MVSVIIPTFNRVKTLGRAVESVLAQTHQDLEIVIADDGSTDGTSEMLSQYGNKVRIVRQANQGPSAARNLGARAARGDMLSFLDSDDTWHPEKLRKQLRVLEQAGNQLACCICNATLKTSSGSPTTSFEASGIQTTFPCGYILNPSQLLATRFILLNQVVTLPRKVFEEVGGFNDHLWILEDHDFALRLSIHGPWGFVSEPLVTKIESEGNLGGIARTSPINHLAAVVTVLDGILKRTDLPQPFRTNLIKERKRITNSIAARKLATSASRPLSLAGKGWIKYQRVQTALSRRSPWWPLPRIAPLGDETQSAVLTPIDQDDRNHHRSR